MPAKKSSKMTRRTKATLWLMIAPTALLISVFLIWALLALILPLPPQNQGYLSYPEPQTTIFGIIYLVGAFIVLTWLPAMIIGIILLVTARKK